MPRETLGQRIERLRKERGMTQFELSERSGVKRQYISMLETGYKGSANPTLETMKVVANALDITVARLLDGIC